MAIWADFPLCSSVHRLRFTAYPRVRSSNLARISTSERSRSRGTGERMLSCMSYIPKEKGN